MPSQEPRIVITRGTTDERLHGQAAEHSSPIVVIIGKGARARKRIDRLCREVPSFVPGESPDDREHVAIRHDGSLTAIAWHRDEPGKPPVFELNDLRDPQGVFRNR